MAPVLSKLGLRDQFLEPLLQEAGVLDQRPRIVARNRKPCLCAFSNDILLPAALLVAAFAIDLRFVFSCLLVKWPWVSFLQLCKRMEERRDGCIRFIKASEEPQERDIAVYQPYEVGAVVHRDGARLQLVEDLLEASEDERGCWFVEWAVTGFLRAFSGDVKDFAVCVNKVVAPEPFVVIDRV